MNLCHSRALGNEPLSVGVLWHTRPDAVTVADAAEAATVVALLVVPIELSLRFQHALTLVRSWVALATAAAVKGLFAVVVVVVEGKIIFLGLTLYFLGLTLEFGIC